MTSAEALYALGVREDTLSPEERDALDRDGYLPLPDILDQGQVAYLTQVLEELLAAEGDAAGKEVHQEAGTARLSTWSTSTRRSRSASRIRGCSQRSRTCSEAM